MPDVEPLSPGGLDPAGQSGGRDAVAAEYLCESVQPVARRTGPPVPGALQKPGGGSGRRAGTPLSL